MILVFGDCRQHHPATSMETFLKGYSLKVSEEINRKVFIHIFSILCSLCLVEQLFGIKFHRIITFSLSHFLLELHGISTGVAGVKTVPQKATARVRLQNSHSAVKCHLEVSVSITTQSSSLWAAAVPVNTRWSKRLQLTLEELFLKRIIMGSL